MKEIRITKMIEQTEVKFVADDGKEFVGEKAEYECKEYERKCNKKKVEERFNRLNAIPISIPVANYFDSDAEFWKITLNSKDDWYAMTDYFEVVKYCLDNGYMERPKEYPCTKIVVLGYDWFDEYKSLKEELEKVLEQLG